MKIKIVVHKAEEGGFAERKAKRFYRFIHLYISKQ